MASLIVAVAQNWAIGKNNDLLWHLPKDLKFFKEKTLGHYVIMGRKSYESIPEKYRPLPNRINVIVTRNKDYKMEGCVVVNSIEDGIKLAVQNGDTEPFVIGGGQIYKQAIQDDLIDKMYITEVHKFFEGDAFFPAIDKDIWKEIGREKHLSDEKNKLDFDFVTYAKK